jgi:hypothetical protein
MALQSGLYDSRADVNAAFDLHVTGRPHGGSYEFVTRNLHSGNHIKFGTMNTHDISQMITYVRTHGPGGGPMSGSREALDYLGRLMEIAKQNRGFLPDGFNTKIR